MFLSFDRLFHPLPIMLQYYQKRIDQSVQKQQQKSQDEIMSFVDGMGSEHIKYTKSGKALAWGVFLFSFGYDFALCFLGVAVWNQFRPWCDEWWNRYFAVRYFFVPCAMACVTAVWFGAGGIIGLRDLFRDLGARGETDALDDGRVEGNVSLSDKQSFDAVDRRE